MIRIVIVDDEKDLVDALVDYFGEMKIEVIGIGHDGKTGIMLYDQHKPDVILMDMDMPKYDGRFAIEKIKKLDPKAKIMVITGHFPFDLKMLSNSQGVFVHYKPLDLKKLVLQIDAMVKLGDKTLQINS
jgi:two-component system chemotaxis response regulator CheY